MYKIDEKFFNNLLKDYARSTVCRLCKQVEMLESKKDLTEVQKLDVLKSFNRELLYEVFRDLEKQVKCFQAGQTFAKFKIYTPNSDENKSG